MRGQTIILAGDAQRRLAKHLINQAPQGAAVHINEKGELRTKAQNRLLHRWFADIASHHSFGQSAAEVKADCNLIYGLPIMTQEDAEWASAFSYIFADLSRPAKIRAIRILDIPFTRRMNTKSLSEYMDQMQRDYAQNGVTLTDPEARKYEAAQ